MARKQSEDLFDLLNKMVGKDVLRKAAEHVTDQVSDDSQPAQPGEKGQEIEQEIKDEYGDTGVTEDQDATSAPDENPASTVPADPSRPEEPSTTQPIPEESPGHVTNEALADTTKQAKYAQWKDSLEKMGSALGDLADVLGSIKFADGATGPAGPTGPAESEEETPGQETEEDKKKDEAQKESSVDEVAAGKEAAEKVASLLAQGAQEAENQQVLNFVETIVKKAEVDADVLCDFLDGYIMSKPDSIRKEAGLPPMGPGMEQALMGAGTGGMGTDMAGAGAPAPAQDAGGAPMELTFEELIQILQALMAGKTPETPEEKLVADLLSQAGLNATPQPQSQEEAMLPPQEQKPASVDQVKQLMDLLKTVQGLTAKEGDK